jgi:hypothetical protein
MLIVATKKYQQSYGYTIPSILPNWTPPSIIVSQSSRVRTSSSKQLHAALPQQQDIEVIQLVVGQENYGLAVVCVGEALWSFLSAPSLDHVKVLIPAGIAAAVLVLISGPMITSGDVNAIGTGLWIATATSTALGVSYIARMIAPYSPSPKEIAGLGLLVAIAGFFSFAQNLLVDGFVILPSLPTITLPDVSSILETEGSSTSVGIPDMASTKSITDAPSLPIELPTNLPEIPLNEVVPDSISSEVQQ